MRCRECCVLCTVCCVLLLSALCLLFSLLSSLFFCAAGLEILAAVEAEARTGEINTTAISLDPRKISQLSQSRLWLLCYGVQGER